MKQLISMSQNQTMTSKELVEVINAIRKEEGNNVEIQHKEMLTKIRTLEPILGLRSITPDKYLSSINQEQPMFRLDKRASLLLVSTESPRVNLAIIDRWQELEVQNRPLTYREALREMIRMDEEREQMQLARIEDARQAAIKQIETDCSTDYFTVRKIRSMNPDMKIDGKILGRVASVLNQPAKQVFDLYEQPVNTYSRTVWEEAYPDAELP